MSTYRERREARAERLRGWADKRESAAAATFASHEVYRGDTAFNTQPGHIPLRAKVNAQDDRAHASLQKANSMNSRADNIEAALEVAIYSDDDDAVERLEARIAGLEAQRTLIKQFNASCRKGRPDESLLDNGQRQSIALSRQFAPYNIGKKGEYPDYELANLGGRITRDRKRLAGIKRVLAG